MTSFSTFFCFQSLSTAFSLNFCQGWKKQKKIKDDSILHICVQSIKICVLQICSSRLLVNQNLRPGFRVTKDYLEFSLSCIDQISYFL